MSLRSRAQRLLVLATAIFSNCGTGWAACTVTATPVAFGQYRPTSSVATTTSGTITLVCTQLLTLLPSYTISLSAGGGSTYGNRRLASGTVFLRYQLYRDAGRQVVWGDGSGGSSTLTDTVLLSLLSSGKSYTVYGAISAGQNVAPGIYTDTILVTVTY